MRSAWVVRIGQRLTKQRLLGQEAGVGEGVGERTKDARSIAFLHLTFIPSLLRPTRPPELWFFIVQPGCMQRLY